MKPIPRLTVLSREYCHLCEEMVAALHALQGRFSFEVDVIDVDGRPELESRWGDLVPVLLDGDTELCHYRLDPEVVGARLARIE